jgi:NAD(P)-dependent dehydrogenase (short-subunit alcohol dehydrogenase family)
MAKIFITGSADGLGQLSAKALADQGHEVVLHARNSERGRDAIEKVPNAMSLVTGDLSNLEETKRVAHEVKALGPFDAVIHNAGVYQASSGEIFAVNVLAPYLLTCLLQKPKRLIYVSSGLHLQGHATLPKPTTGNYGVSYSDSKLYVLMLCKAVARQWPDVYSNAVNPGWVPTKMGGPGAPDDLQKGYETQSWLAVSDDNKAKVSGRYFFHKMEERYHQLADDVLLQEKLLSFCEEMTGELFPK